jgi:hypothetical protein
MTDSVRPRDAEQPRDSASSAGEPKAVKTLKRVSFFTAFDSSGCSGVGVAPRPSTRQSQPSKNSVLEKIEVDSKRSANETTDALSKNLNLDGKRLVFLVDRLFHRRIIGTV